MESSTSIFKGEINKMKVDIRKYTAKIKENNQKLKIQTGMPHLVSTIAEIFDLENMEQEQDSG